MSTVPHLTREQIETIQEQAHSAEIMFLCQMALENGEDGQAWQAADMLAHRGLLDANPQAGDRNNSSQPGR